MLSYGSTAQQWAGGSLVRLSLGLCLKPTCWLTALPPRFTAKDLAYTFSAEPLPSVANAVALGMQFLKVNDLPLKKRLSVECWALNQVRLLAQPCCLIVHTVVHIVHTYIHIVCLKVH